MRKFISLAGSMAILAASVLPAIATGNNCVNETTGPLSSNFCTVTNTNSVKVTNENDADIKNDVKVTANSGHNTASMNTLGGSVVTGNASVDASLSNTANVNTTSVSGGPAASGNVGKNSVTGADSNNVITLTNVNDVEVENENDARVENEVDAVADSGWNRADMNTGPGYVRSGNSSMEVGVVNRVNDSATAVVGGAGGTGGNQATNQTTGALSSNFVTMTNVSDVKVENENDMDVKNGVKAVANTGWNSASSTTLGGEIRSGNAVGDVDLETEGNINTTSVTSAMGGFANVSGNSVTGPMSVNTESLVNSQDVEVANENKSADVENEDFDLVDTGWNRADMNTGGGSILSGMSDLVKRICVYVNDSFTVIN
jgi:hypothetical protein